MRSPDVAVVGDINVDILAAVDHYPEEGGHGLADELHMESGGSAANTAVGLGLLGLDVVMLGRVGDDPLAEYALHGLRSAGVDVSQVRRDAGMTTGLFFVAITPGGERTMFGGRGANGRLSPEDITPTAIESARWLHLSGYPLLTRSGRAALRQAIDLAREANIPISLDVGVGLAMQHWRAIMVEFTVEADVLLPNQVEAEWLTGEHQPAQAARWLHRRGVQTVVVKLGARGCYLSTGSEERTLPAFNVTPVDATGAGDAFNAGFIAGRLVGLDVRASTLLANALGGLATTVLGAGAALPGPARVLEFLEQHRDDPRWGEWGGEFNVVCAWLARAGLKAPR